MDEYQYHIDEGSLSLPADFRDASVNVFEWMSPEGICTLTVQREKKHGRSFEKMIEQTTAPYAKSFPAFAEEEPLAFELEVPTVGRRFRWRNEKGVQYHHQAFVDLGDSMLVLTAGGSARTAERVDEVLLQALNGMRLREPA